MYVCMHACVYVFMYVCMYACMHVCMNVCMLVDMYVHDVYVNIHMYNVYTYMYRFVFMCSLFCLFVEIYFLCPQKSATHIYMFCLGPDLGYKGAPIGNDTLRRTLLWPPPKLWVPV